MRDRDAHLRHRRRCGNLQQIGCDQLRRAAGRTRTILRGAEFERRNSRAISRWNNTHCARRLSLVTSRNHKQPRPDHGPLPCHIPERALSQIWDRPARYSRRWRLDAADEVGCVHDLTNQESESPTRPRRRFAATLGPEEPTDRSFRDFALTFPHHALEPPRQRKREPKLGKPDLNSPQLST